MSKKNIYFFLGTTAELIKVAPVIKELQARNISYKIITSGQNYISFEDLEKITGSQKVYHSFRLKSTNLPIPMMLEFFLWMVRSFYIFMLYFRNEFNKVNKANTYFIVHGDTVSACLGALVSRINGVKVAHIESGYRSFNFFEPFPEEICRYIISMLADIHFCPNQWCLNNLSKNSGEKINTIVNTAYDSCMKAIKLASKPKLLTKLKGTKYFILILHRQEHMLFQKELTKKFIEIFTSHANQNLKCVFVLHHITKNFLEQENLLNSVEKNPNVITTPRLSYPEFMKVLSNAEFIASDGGGNQQESYYLGIPCLILRKYTEQIEGLDNNAVLAKDDLNRIKDFLKNYKKFKKPQIKVKKLPSKIIVDYLMQHSD